LSCIIAGNTGGAAHSGQAIMILFWNVTGGGISRFQIQIESFCPVGTNAD